MPLTSSRPAFRREGKRGDPGDGSTCPDNGPAATRGTRPRPKTAALRLRVPAVIRAKTPRRSPGHGAAPAHSPGPRLSSVFKFTPGGPQMGLMGACQWAAGRALGVTACIAALAMARACRPVVGLGLWSLRKPQHTRLATGTCQWPQVAAASGPAPGRVMNKPTLNSNH
jgi:hypothetical protein